MPGILGESDSGLVCRSRNLLVVEDGSAHRRRPPARNLGHAAEGLAAAQERLLGQVGPFALGRHPRLRLFDQCVHLRKQQARRRVFPLERLDAPQSPQDRGGLVHATTLAGKVIRVCDWTVPKALRSFPPWLRIRTESSPRRGPPSTEATLERP